MVICKCFFVDGQDVDIRVNRNANGSDLFDSVCKFLNIEDRTPFGLIHRNGSKPATYNWWVRLDKPLRKQIKGKCKVWVFALVVKFYPKENIANCEEILRYYTLVQVRDDLLTGRLPCPTKVLATLAAYWAQSEYGQFSFKSVDQELAGGFRFVRPDEKLKNADDEIDQDETFLDKMIEIHKKLRNMSATDADIKFLSLASTLSMYGTHYYPGFEWFSAGQRFFSKHPPELTDPVTVGVGFKGISVHKAKKNAPQQFAWNAIHAIAYRKNLVLLKLHRTMKTKDRTHVYLAFESLNQAKTVWRAAIEMHVHCRVEKKAQQAHSVSVKLKRRWSFSGPQTATTVKSVSTPRLRLPRLATIAESTPNDRPAQKQERTTKEIISSDLKQKYSALFPLKSSKNNTPRSIVSQKPLSSSLAQHDFAPFIGDLNRSRSEMHSLSFSHLPNREVAPKATGFLKETFIDPPSSARSKNRRTVSETSIAGIEVFPAPSDQHVVGRRNVMNSAQSYTEEHRNTAVQNWLEENSVGKHIRRSRPQSAPSRPRPQLRGRSFNELHFHQRNNDHSPMTSSKQQRASETKMKIRDLSPPRTITYEDEPTRRRPERYRSADNFVRKDWTIRREPVYAFDPAARRFADVYKNEYLRNLTDDPHYGSYRRAKSMHALGSHDRRMNRSPSLDCHLSISSSTVSAHASSGSTRSHDSFLGPYYNDDFYHQMSELPPDSSLSRRILSESRLHTRPSLHPTYDMYLQQSEDNLDSARGMVQRSWTPAGREASAYSSHFQSSRDSFF